jgi:hypothetical protein
VSAPVAQANELVVVDAHVHIHDCYPLSGFFDRAFENLIRAARGAGRDTPPRAVLLMTEAEPDDWFAKLATAARSTSGTEGLAEPGAWSFATTDEPCAVVARAPGREILVIAGRQVACAEDLEVLTLCTLGRIPDGLPIEETLSRAKQIDAVSVIPWGPGKWLGARGKLLSSLLMRAQPGELFLGDESSRPFFWGTPRHFHNARERGLGVLPGTDPLPFPREQGRAGSFGYWTWMPLDARRPADAMKTHLRCLRNPEGQIHPFGSLEGPALFVRNQIAMQLRKRRRKRVA